MAAKKKAATRKKAHARTTHTAAKARGHRPTTPEMRARFEQFEGRSLSR